ncbi:serine/threonine-protein kinase ulk3 [Anaeramoeba ignava]|uniref:Serine/threonine-protein kinase ulk3 n=1 Tax=Anaeramoeba ignava TaxID=1746090 RepID=A0A9Q0L7A1_ANAIG|nr:serine/threonine-protein kinase ulk3 [Anaeramoeba ignava]
MSSQKYPKGNKFKTSRIIGKGSFAIVYKGEIIDTDKICAVKEIDLKSTTIPPEKIFREIEVMQSIKHENAVELFFVEPKDYEKAEKIYLVMEFCDKGNLGTFLEERKKSNPLTLQEIQYIFKGIFKSLNHLFEKSMMHRDLKPENILLKEKTGSPFGYIIKLADFGFARELQETNLLDPKDLAMTICGTPLYMAPEVLSGKYTYKADLWSLGAIYYQVITGDPPFIALTFQELKKIFKQKTQKSLPEKLNVNVPQSCRDLIKGLLVTDPKLRIGINEVKKNSFLAGRNKEAKEILPIINQDNFKEKIQEIQTRIIYLQSFANEICLNNSYKALVLYLFAANYLKFSISETQKNFPEILKKEEVKPMINLYLEIFKKIEKLKTIIKLKIFQKNEEKIDSASKLIYERSVSLFEKAHFEWINSKSSFSLKKLEETKCLFEILYFDFYSKSQKKLSKKVLGWIKIIEFDLDSDSMN